MVYGPDAEASRITLAMRCRPTSRRVGASVFRWRLALRGAPPPSRLLQGGSLLWPLRLLKLRDALRQEFPQFTEVPSPVRSYSHLVKCGDKDRLSPKNVSPYWQQVTREANAGFSVIPGLN